MPVPILYILGVTAPGPWLSLSSLSLEGAGCAEFLHDSALFLIPEKVKLPMELRRAPPNGKERGGRMPLRASRVPLDARTCARSVLGRALKMRSMPAWKEAIVTDPVSALRMCTKSSASASLSFSPARINSVFTSRGSMLPSPFKSSMANVKSTSTWFDSSTTFVTSSVLNSSHSITPEPSSSMRRTSSAVSSSVPSYPISFSARSNSSKLSVPLPSESSFSQISAQKLSWSVEMRPGGTPISRSCMSPWYSKLCASAQLVATSRSTGSLRAPPGPLILCPWVDRILIPISRAEGELVDTFMVLRLAAAATPSCCSARRTAALPAELLLRPPSCCPRREPSCWRTPS
mmetsp:Transcript_14423/g.34261  ORF Transcript_14423/g.34261 Transcript_14423/m.34261 type:complete len:347 (+) Transcript_14423:40-1080(+)